MQRVRVVAVKTSANGIENAGGRIYLDHNATTRPSSRVMAQVRAWLDEWGNPSSIHDDGRGPKAILREARLRLAQQLGVSPLEIIFTSGGSEGNNQVIKGVFSYLKRKHDELSHPCRKWHLLVGATEHPSVKGAAQSLIPNGVELSSIPVHRDGSIDLEAFARLLRPNETFLVSMMYANNETGSIYPVAEMARIAHQAGALFHSDCVQALGKVPLALESLNVDYATFSGHKFYALRGSGILWAKKGAPIDPLIHGGGHERGRRGGTENVLAQASLGEMSQASGEINSKQIEIARLRDQMERAILDELPETLVTGAGVARLPNTSSLVLPGVDGETLLMNLDMQGISVSTGAACSSGSQEPSPTLVAMGLSRAEAQSSLRISLGWGTTEDEIQRFIPILTSTVRRMRAVTTQAGRELR